MSENREEQYFKKEKFNSLLEKEDWFWDKRSYDFLIEDSLILERIWRDYHKRLMEQRKRWREIAKKLFKGK